MAKTWRKYEILVLFDAGLGVEASEELTNRIRGFITDAGGRMLKTERWGVRDMAFEIKHQKKAYYLLLEYAGEGAVSTELARQLNLLDIVIKFQSIKLAEGLDPADLPDTEEDIALEAPAEEAAEESKEEVAGEEDGDEEEVAEEAADEDEEVSAE